MAITLEAIRAAGGIVHSDGNIFFRDISMMQGLAGAAPAAVAPQGERQWICPTRTVADLVNNLLTMDQALPIYGAQYIEKDGRRCAIAVPPTVSRERVKDGRWIGQGEELNAAVIWTRAEQPAAVSGPAWGEQQVHALAIHMAASAPPSHKPRDYDADMAWARSALAFITGHTKEAPALEAPAAESAEMALRRMLCIAYSGALAYMDDGEMQDSRCCPSIDFKRDTVDEIAAKFVQRSSALAAAPQAPAQEAPAAGLPEDTFRGDTPSLVRNILALLELDADGALVPHGVGGHARGLLSAAAARLAAAPQAPAAPVEQDYARMYQNLADAMGYDSGKDGIEWSPEEWAAHLLAAYRAAPAAPAVDARTPIKPQHPKGMTSVNARLSFDHGWKAAERAHGIRPAAQAAAKGEHDAAD